MTQTLIYIVLKNLKKDAKTKTPPNSVKVTYIYNFSRLDSDNVLINYKTFVGSAYSTMLIIY